MEVQAHGVHLQAAAPVPGVLAPPLSKVVAGAVREAPVEVVGVVHLAQLMDGALSRFPRGPKRDHRP